MKKLMIAAAIVCVAVVSQAATANWGVGFANMYNGKGKDAAKVAANTSFYVFDANLITQAQLYNAFASADLSKFDITKQTGYAATLKTSALGVSNVNSVLFAYGDQSSATETIHQDFFFALVDGDTIYLSETKGGDAYKGDTPQSLAYGSQITSPLDSKALPSGTGFDGVGHWSAAAVPEPTSGLLLLLGVAGLALRRRRN